MKLHCLAAVSALSPAQLANQMQLRMREQVSRYYDSVLRSDDELNPAETRNVCLRVQASAPDALTTLHFLEQEV